MSLHTFTFISPKNDNLKAMGANRTFSHDVTAAILVLKNNQTAAMLVFQTSPVGADLFSYVI